MVPWAWCAHCPDVGNAETRSPKGLVGDVVERMGVGAIDSVMKHVMHKRCEGDVMVQPKVSRDPFSLMLTIWASMQPQLDTR